MPEKRSRHARLQVLSKRWRDAEGDLISQMGDLLPYPEEVKCKLSRSAILKLSKAFLVAKQIEGELGSLNGRTGDVHLFLEARGGFMLTVQHTGLIIYASDDVYTMLGFQQHEVVGAHIAEFLHPEDHSDFVKQLRLWKERNSRSQPIPKSARVEKTDSSKTTHETSKCTCERNGISHDSPYYPYGVNLEGKLEFVTRIKYKIVGSGNKTKQTGYITIYVRGVVKEASSQHWLLVAACYPVCLLPSLRLQFYDLVGVTRYNSNMKVLHVEDRLNEYFGFDLADYYKNHNHETDCWHDDDHFNQSDHAFVDDILERRGSLVTSYKMVTRNGRLFIGVCVMSAVYGPKGEHLYYISVDYVIRQERIKIKFWPIRKNVLFLPDVCGLTGEGEICIPCRLHQVIDASVPTSPDDESCMSEVPEKTIKSLSPILIDPSSVAATSVKESGCNELDVVDGRDVNSCLLTLDDFHQQETSHGVLPCINSAVCSESTPQDSLSNVAITAGITPDEFDLDLSEFSLDMERDAAPGDICDALLSSTCDTNSDLQSSPHIGTCLEAHGNIVSELGWENLDLGEMSPVLLNQTHVLPGQEDFVADAASHDIDLLLSGGLDDFLAETQDAYQDPLPVSLGSAELSNVASDEQIYGAVTPLSNHSQSCSPGLSVYHGVIPSPVGMSEDLHSAEHIDSLGEQVVTTDDHNPLIVTDFDLTSDVIEFVTDPKHSELILPGNALSPALSVNDCQELLEKDGEEGNVADILSSTDFLDLI